MLMNTPLASSHTPNVWDVFLRRPAFPNVLHSGEVLWLNAMTHTREWETNKGVSNRKPGFEARKVTWLSYFHIILCLGVVERRRAPRSARRTFSVVSLKVHEKVAPQLAPKGPWRSETFGVCEWCVREGIEDQNCCAKISPRWEFYISTLTILHAWKASENDNRLLYNISETPNGLMSILFYNSTDVWSTVIRKGYVPQEVVLLRPIRTLGEQLKPERAGRSRFGVL